MTRLLLVVIAVCLFFIGYTVRWVPFMYRAYIPYPISYVDRLRALDGWSTEPGTGFNCSGFVSNARQTRFRTSSNIYNNVAGDLLLVAEATNKDGIDERKLRPGDLASFEGPAWNRSLYGVEGVHVAAYLGDGVWIDADARRGYVEKFKMTEKERGDDYFAGHVRLYRWNNPVYAAPWTTIGKDDISH